MQDQRTHIIHHRTSEEQRTLGYRIVDASNGAVRVVCAETRCHPNDNFNKRVGRSHVENRLQSYLSGNRSERLRAFEADITIANPTNAKQFRELEQTLLLLADYRLPTPAAIQS